MKNIYLLSLSLCFFINSSHLFAEKSDSLSHDSEGEWFTWTHFTEAASVVAPVIDEQPGVLRRFRGGGALRQQ